MADHPTPQPMIHVPGWLWLVLSAVISFTITAGTGFIAAASSLSPGTTLTTLSVVIILIGGVIQAAKDIKTYIAPAPESVSTVVHAPNVVVNMPEASPTQPPPPTIITPSGTDVSPFPPTGRQGHG